MKFYHNIPPNFSSRERIPFLSGIKAYTISISETANSKESALTSMTLNHFKSQSPLTPAARYADGALKRRESAAIHISENGNVGINNIGSFN